MRESAKRIRRRGGQPGNTNALRHGRTTAAAKAERRRVRELILVSEWYLRHMLGAAPERQSREGDAA